MEEFKDYLADKMQEVFSETEDDLMVVLGLDSDTVKNGPEYESHSEFVFNSAHKRLPRKFKKNLKKVFGPYSYKMWKKNNVGSKLPKRYVVMVRDRFNKVLGRSSQDYVDYHVNQNEEGISLEAYSNLV